MKLKKNAEIGLGILGAILCIGTATALGQVSNATANPEPIEPTPEGTPMQVCAVDADFISYEDYNLINDETSPAYAYIQEHMEVRDDGLLYNENNAIGVALSTRYGTIGDEFDITFSSGDKLHAVIVDEKYIAQLTDNCTDANGGILEMVCDTNLIDEHVKLMGSFDSVWNGTITAIVKL